MYVYGTWVGDEWAVLGELLDSMVSKDFFNLNNSEIPRATPAPSPAAKILPHKPNTIVYSSFC